MTETNNFPFTMETVNINTLTPNIKYKFTYNKIIQDVNGNDVTVVDYIDEYSKEQIQELINKLTINKDSIQSQIDKHTQQITSIEANE